LPGVTLPWSEAHHQETYPDLQWKSNDKNIHLWHCACHQPQTHADKKQNRHDGCGNFNGHHKRSREQFQNQRHGPRRKPELLWVDQLETLDQRVNGQMMCIQRQIEQNGENILKLSGDGNLRLGLRINHVDHTKPHLKIHYRTRNLNGGKNQPYGISQRQAHRRFGKQIYGKVDHSLRLHHGQMPNERKDTQAEKEDKTEFNSGRKLLASQYGDEHNKSRDPNQNEDKAFKFAI